MLAYIKANRRTYLCHHLGIAFLAFAGYGSVYWAPTFFMRHHHWTAAEAGRDYGIVIAIAGSLGIVSGGWLADRLAMRGYADAYLRVAMAAAVTLVPLGSVYLLVSDSHLAVFLLALGVFFNSVP